MVDVTDQIYAELQAERQKLNAMPLGDELTLKQSLVVDRLIVVYYRALAEERKRGR